MHDSSSTDRTTRLKSDRGSHACCEGWQVGMETCSPRHLAETFMEGMSHHPP